jgi:hypothetical protein
MKEDQLNVRNIGQVFGLFPDSIYLISAEDGSVETPSERGIFNLLSYLSYEVLGTALKAESQTGSHASKGSPSHRFFASTEATPSARPPRGVSIKTKWPARPPGVTSANSKEEWTKNIQIHHYANGRLNKLSNFPVIVTESSATTKHIAQQLSQEAFGGENVILLDNDNLQVPVTTASKGIQIILHAK